jgi:shikimate dehydrogenase
MLHFGLVGKKLGHSFSKRWFEERFEEHQRAECSYSNIELETIDNVLDRTSYLKGFNVTIPYKNQILPYLDELSPEAEEIGAVNCVVRGNDNKLIGYNTDYYGFMKSLAPLLRNRNITQALVLGATGGAARAVLHALNNLNINVIKISRTSINGMLTYEQLTEEIIRESLLIVNCTPAGMFPDVHSAPQIDYEHICNQHILYDLVYNPPLTEFLNRGRKRGATVKNGLEMLHLQAELSWELFFRNNP